jgi:chitinase
LANESLDNEDNLPAYFDTLASTLRTNYATDSSKSYYLSSAPQCPFPDASIPLTMILLCDFVFVQFYNNVPCEIGSHGFNDSVRQWSSALEASTLNTKPRLYVGAPAWSAAGPTAYQHIGTPQGIQAVASQIEEMGLSNFGGVMFWDGPEGMLDVEGGKDIITWAKEGLVGS